MALAPGTRLGPYEIAALLGKGGMGEVYRARDVKLQRDVAIKTLPDSFAQDTDRLARFEREARTLASLNHPNIAQIHGLEESEGIKALVMELVEGATLADRIAQRTIPLDEALPIAKQIAEALEAAHEQGIIHRDLKPANVKVRPNGTVKVLDFGLAKALEPVSAGSVSATASPTITSPARMTGVGVLLGTAAYMSPEQARGKTVDKRADVWAFGCVLYEMLIGRRAFEGDDVSSTIARVIEREPDWQALDLVTPAPVTRIVRRCLQKDPQNRLRDIGDARLELREAMEVQARRESTDRMPAGNRRRPIVLASVVIAGLILGALGLRWLLTAEPRVEPAITGRRLNTEINLPADVPLALDSEAADIGFDSTLIDISPDGRTLVYVGISGGTSRLLARQLDSFEVRSLAGTEGAIHPFFAPDGRVLGFLTNDKVKSYSFTTGTTSTIGDAGTPVAGTWTADDQIFVAVEEGRRLVRYRVGGAPVVVAEPIEGARYSRVTPDGKSALLTYLRNSIGADFAEIRLRNLTTGETKTLTTNGYDARLTSAGFLVFGRSGRVFAARFDSERRAVGDPVPIASGVRMHALYPHLQLAVSSTGLMVYIPGGDVGVAGLAWVDRQNRAEALDLKPAVYGRFDLADDGRRLAIQVIDNKDYILIYDIARNSSRRLETPESAGWPKWSSSGDALAYTSFAEGKPYRILIQQVDSDRPPMAVAESTTRLTPTTWSQDAQRLTFYEYPTNRLGIVSLSREREPSPPKYVGFPASTHDISPDGRWLVYANAGINVRAMPEGDRVEKIADPGSEPLWCRKCDELLFRRGNRWYSAQLHTGPTFEWQQPRLIVQTQFNDSPGPSWGLSPDGRRILVLKRKEESIRTRLNVIDGWLGDVIAK